MKKNGEGSQNWAPGGLLVRRPAFFELNHRDWGVKSQTTTWGEKGYSKPEKKKGTIGIRPDTKVGTGIREGARGNSKPEGFEEKN